MTPLESMRLRMAETGLYTFSGQTAGTALDWELEAYAAGLEPFYKQVKEFLENSFPETAREKLSPFGRAFWEFVGKGSQKRNGAEGFCCVLPLFRKQGRPSAGGRSNGSSHIHCGGAGRICCMTEGTPEEKEISRFKRSIGGFVPAHLRMYLDCRPLSWQDIEEKGYSWNRWIMPL